MFGNEKEETDIRTSRNLPKQEIVEKWASELNSSVYAISGCWLPTEELLDIVLGFVTLITFKLIHNICHIVHRY